MLYLFTAELCTVVVMYCELMYKLLYKVLKNVAYYKEFKAIFDSVLTFEQYFAQTSKQKGKIQYFLFISKI